MLPWPPRRWGAGEEEPSFSAGSDPDKTWNSRGEVMGAPRTRPQDSPQPRVRNPSRNPSRTWRELLPRHPPGLVAQQYRGTPVPFSSQMAWGMAPSRMTLLAPWDPNYEAKAGAQLVWRPSSSSGASFSGRTLCHPSFWPLYEAASGRCLRPQMPSTGYQNREQVSRDAGFPVMCCEDVFFSDPLLPRGQRVPLYLSEAPQQVMGSLKLQLPPPIMSPCVLPTPTAGCSTAWLSGPELIALTGLLQMSQGEPKPSSSASSGVPTTSDASQNPVSESPGPSGNCSHFTDPALP